MKKTKQTKFKNCIKLIKKWSKVLSFLLRQYNVIVNKRNTKTHNCKTNRNSLLLGSEISVHK